MCLYHYILHVFIINVIILKEWSRHTESVLFMCKCNKQKITFISFTS